MDNSTIFSRRSFLGGVSAAALLPGLAKAQTPLTFESFAARARALSGFDAIPRALLSGARSALADTEIDAFVSEDGSSDNADKTVLKALYTGMHAPAEGTPERFAYAQALMYATIEDAVNVPSYCGGLPGYWSEKPDNV
ncbi:sugar dehydrogenase complex small subunit [uncultured Marivita sp.]|uniref:sugar dehydrogenase complex small subunit n=1 Tax=uncultured Marivita sp. TaxID=888080 RepID=UPI0026139015|nr:sugar dehydrogenase complex small subunit [uncultured Marivita sp.]